MKDMTVYFVPHSTFRGRRPPRSDTLFGAICWGYRLLFGPEQLEELLRLFTATTVPFLLSSMFQYLETGEEKTHFLPKPRFYPAAFGDRDPIQNLEALEKDKKIQKTQWVSQTEFSRILAGQRVELSTPFTDPIQEIRQTPHSSINRLTWTVDSDQFFSHEEFSLLAKDSHKQGVFFCVKCQEAFERNLKTVFYFLADKGIGGGVSVGKGQFTSIDIQDQLPYSEPSDEESKHVVTLSLTYPDDTLRPVLPESWYTLEKRQGKIESMYTVPTSGHIWKDHVLMLQEGSTFPKNRNLYYGENRVTRKDDGKLGFDVQQYGYAFTVNTKFVKAD